MTVIRKNVYELGSVWADDILWYARGVQKLDGRAVHDVTSWKFFTGIHGFSEVWWNRLHILEPGETLPAQNIQQRYWNQCQHGSWYFLPWHRGYLLALESLIRAAVIEDGGPEYWALPYWNYFKDGQATLPVEFASADWPDGSGQNPLFIEQRWGPLNDGNVHIPNGEIHLDAMEEGTFAG